MSSTLLPAAVDTFQVDVLHMVAVLREVLVLDTAAHTVHACNEAPKLTLRAAGMYQSLRKAKYSNYLVP